MQILKSNICKYQFGVRVPRNIAEAYKLDQENGNSLWTEAIDREVKLLRDDFECFRNGEESEITEDYQKIPKLWTFAVKFDGRHRARLCAGGHSFICSSNLNQDGGLINTKKKQTFLQTRISKCILICTLLNFLINKTLFNLSMQL